MDKVYVIVKSEYDGSGGPEVLRVLTSKERADSDFAMLERAMLTGRIQLLEAEFDASPSEGSDIGK